MGLKGRSSIMCGFNRSFHSVSLPSSVATSSVL